MNVLLTNDDGIFADGLHTLSGRLKACADLSGVEIHKVYVVAPEENQSACSHSMTLHRPLRIREVDVHRYAVSGTPADCISLGLSTVITDAIDLVVSGINHGANLGTDIANSGTVSGAMQAAQMGIPAIAVSLAARLDEQDRMNFEPAVEAVCHVMRKMLEHKMPDNTLLNINVPNLSKTEKVKLEFEVTKMGILHYSRNFERRLDPRQHPYYWNNSKEIDREQPNPNSDVAAIQSGRVSVTPLQIDYTNQSLWNEMKSWGL